MGVYFNPGNESFKRDSGDKLYVDKTGLIGELNKILGSAKCCISISHARRFGKSQAAGMIDAYYSLGCDSKELFSKFEIATAPDFETHLNKYNVIHVDISSIADSHTEDLVFYLTQSIYKDLQVEFKSVDYTGIISSVLDQVYKISGKTFVIILDEWDCLIRNYSNHSDLVHSYLQFLHTIFKSEESKRYLALGYITGILPIKKIKDESALNNFKEYTMISSKRFTKYFGFTEDEVKILCKKYDMQYESVKEWYDGYLIDGMQMYNPDSIYCAMTEHSLESYWKNTSSFESINDLITLNMDGLKEDIISMIKGNRVVVDVNTFKNDFSTINTKDEALTALIHLGYLGFNKDRKEAFIPNFEVSMAYQSALSTGNWHEIVNTISKCDELLFATIDGKAEIVADLMELAHDTYSSILEYNDENSLSCAITMAYFTAPAYYNMVREFPSGKGFADIAMIPRADSGGKPAMIIELKWNQDADTAIQQIKDRRYAGALRGYGGEMLLVGISYNKESIGKKHHCRIEKIKLSS